MKKMIVVLSFLVSAAAAWAATPVSKDKPAASDIRKFLKEKSSFSEEQIDTLAYRLGYAEAEKLPVSHLLGRIKEGVAKKRDFSAIVGVLDRKIAQLKESRDLVENLCKKGMVIKERKYCAHVLGELLEMGYPEADFSELANMFILRKMNCEALLGLAALQMDLRRKGMSCAETKEIINAAVLKNMSPRSIKTILLILKDAKIRGLDIKKARAIAMEGIEKKNIQWLKNNIKALETKQPKGGE